MKDNAIVYRVDFKGKRKKRQTMKAPYCHVLDAILEARYECARYKVKTRIVKITEEVIAVWDVGDVFEETL